MDILNRALPLPSQYNAGDRGKSAEAPPSPRSGAALLEMLPPEMMSRVFSHVPTVDLTTLELVSKSVRVGALQRWRLEIPQGKRQRRPDARETAWKQAWVSQCDHLSTLGAWGAEASQACKRFPNELNPFDVEAQCCEWIASEVALGNALASGILENLFSALTEGRSALYWAGHNLHSMPPFIDKAKALEELSLEGNCLAAVHLEDFPVLEVVNLGDNRLESVSLKNLPALYHLNLERNRLPSLELKCLPQLEWVKVEDNQLVAVQLASLPSLTNLYLSGNQLATIELRSLPALVSAELRNNRLTAFELVGVPALQQFYASNNRLTEVSIENLPALRQLHLQGNPVDTIYLKNVPALEVVRRVGY